MKKSRRVHCSEKRNGYKNGEFVESKINYLEPTSLVQNTSNVTTPLTFRELSQDNIDTIDLGKFSLHRTKIKEVLHQIHKSKTLNHSSKIESLVEHSVQVLESGFNSRLRGGVIMQVASPLVRHISNELSDVVVDGIARAVNGGMDGVMDRGGNKVSGNRGANSVEESGGSLNGNGGGNAYTASGDEGGASIIDKVRDGLRKVLGGKGGGANESGEGGIGNAGEGAGDVGVDGLGFGEDGVYGVANDNALHLSSEGGGLRLALNTNRTTVLSNELSFTSPIEPFNQLAIDFRSGYLNPAILPAALGEFTNYAFTNLGIAITKIPGSSYVIEFMAPIGKVIGGFVEAGRNVGAKGIRLAIGEEKFNAILNDFHNSPRGIRFLVNDIVDASILVGAGKVAKGVFKTGGKVGNNVLLKKAAKSTSIDILVKDRILGVTEIERGVWGIGPVQDLLNINLQSGIVKFKDSIDINRQISGTLKSYDKKFAPFYQEGVVYGRAQKTSGKHKEAIEILTEVYKKDPDVKLVVRDLGLNKVFMFEPKNALNSNIRPDITLVKKDGSFTFIEVLSKSQETLSGQNKMTKKLEDAKRSLDKLGTSAKFSSEIWSQKDIFDLYPDIANKVLKKGGK